MTKNIRVVELFAGVGGFRLGLEGWNGKSSTSAYKSKFKTPYDVIWSNQWEPSTKTQHANLVYNERWECNGTHVGEDIEKVIENDFKNIPDHEMLVGGFPCQDYSVATTLRNSKGLIGKKGVLWWSIYSILKKKGKNRAKYIFLENVDRLLISPTNQRGRDFAVMLSCLNELGYAVEWRVINAAEYGMPQRRRRVYLIGYHKSTKLYNSLKDISPKEVLDKTGVMASAFPVSSVLREPINGKIGANQEKVSNEFNKGKKISPFKNSGFMIDGKFFSSKVIAEYHGEKTTLGDIITPLNKVGQDFIINKKKPVKNPVTKVQMDGKEYNIKTEWDLWKYLKGSKKELKTNKTQGYTYRYAEGSMTFPDALDRPSRTIITGEGGPAPSRFKHVIEQNGTYRRLTPVELERLNMFPDNHTLVEGVTDTKRAFFMGNALVIGVVEKIGLSFAQKIKKADKSALQVH